jgi:hypothetical protein
MYSLSLFLSFPYWPGCNMPPLLLLALWPSPDPQLLPHKFSWGSAWTDLFLYHQPVPHKWLNHHPDDGSSNKSLKHW